MEIDGRSVPHIKVGGPEWEAAMMELDKEAIVKMLKRKYLDEVQEDGEGVSDQGLQIQSRMMDGVKWCPFSDAEKFHTIANAKAGRCMELTAQLDRATKCIEELRAALGDKP